MFGEYDIFGKKSELEQILQDEEVSLSNFNSNPYEVPSSYKKIDVDIDPDNYDSSIRKVCDDLISEISSYGFSGSLYTGIYESILNAYQHGNDSDPNKDIEIYYDVDDNYFRLNVKDEGDKIDSDFIDYYLDIKRNNCDKNYYDYSNKEMNDTNLGHGVKFMNTYFDDVMYFKSKDGGLIAHLYKEK